MWSRVIRFSDSTASNYSSTIWGILIKIDKE